MKLETYIKNLNFKIILLGVFALYVLYFALYASEASATRLYFEPVVGEPLSVNLMLDAEGDDINAIEGRIVFSQNMKLLYINDGDSVVGLWLQRSIFDNDSVVFSGVTPGGYMGDRGPSWEGFKPGKVFELVFKAEKAGLAEISIKDAKVLANDGKGTAVKLSITNFQFSISEEIPDSGLQVSEADDTMPPESFRPEIARDPSIFDGKYFLVFNTQDKNSGIYYYKVKEGSKDFEIAESPHLLKDQNLFSDIVVQVVDNAGNIREEKLKARNEKPSRFKPIFWVIITTGIILFFFIARRKFFLKHKT